MSEEAVEAAAKVNLGGGGNLETCEYCYAEVKSENLSMHEEWHRDMRGW